jgi:hypothetical protein
MKIEEIELIKIIKTDSETKDGNKEVFSASFENKENGIKVNINQDEEFDLVVGENYSFKIETEQKKL